MKFLCTLAFLTLTGGALAAPASMDFASEADRQNYFTVDSIEVRPVQTTLSDLQTFNAFVENSNTTIFPFPTQQQPGSTVPGQTPGQLPGQPPTSTRPPINLPSTGNNPPIGFPYPTSPGGGIGDPLGIQQWITIGERIWQLVANSKPSATVTTQRISVLPNEQRDWAQIESWKGPATRTYEIAAKNGWGSKVVMHRYTIAWNYGGRYNGKGAYIGNLTMIPTAVSVSFGYSLNARVVVGDAVNMASAQEPVPALPIQVESTITNILKHSQGTEAFYVSGNGEFKHINQ